MRERNVVDKKDAAPKRRPRVTIGMPVYNGEKYVRSALDSLLRQTFSDFELVVSDNASTDRTSAILSEYAKRDGRITIYRQERNIGLLRNFWYVLGKARGDFFVWAAHDDTWSPRFIETLIGELTDHPDASAAMCATERVLENGKPFDIVRLSTDTNSMSRFRLAWRAATGRYKYVLYFYGLFRTSLLKEAVYRFPNVHAPDVLFVCQLALATRFRYTDEVLYRRLITDKPILVKYAHEGFGKMYAGYLSPLVSTMALGPYLFSSKIVPARRKLFIPLLVFASLVCTIPRVIYMTSYGIVYTTAGRILGQTRRRVLADRVRRLFAIK
jgi:glycosyltransferase involved in cell wall biosynthesis